MRFSYPTMKDYPVPIKTDPVPIKTDEYGKPLQDAYLEIRFKDSMPVYLGPGIIRKFASPYNEHVMLKVLHFDVNNINGVEFDKVDGLRITTKDGVICYSWAIIAEYWSAFNSDEYVAAIQLFRETCDHKWLETHHVIADYCLKHCGICDKHEPIHGKDESCPKDIVDR